MQHLAAAGALRKWASAERARGCQQKSCPEVALRNNVPVRSALHGEGARTAVKQVPAGTSVRGDVRSRWRHFLRKTRAQQTVTTRQVVGGSTNEGSVLGKTCATTNGSAPVRVRFTRWRHAPAILAPQ